MDSRRVLFFLDLLNSETSGHADELKTLYKRALDDDETVNRLRTLLDDNWFYGLIGESRLEKGKELLKRIYAEPSSALDLIPQLKQVCEEIEAAEKDSREAVMDPAPNIATVSVLKKTDAAAFAEALRAITSSSLYLMLLYEGLDSIKNISWNDNVGIQEMKYAVNTRFLPNLCRIRRPEYSWVIRKRKTGGRALFDIDCFYISYESTHKVEMLCSSLHKEPMGTHSFLNIDAYESGENDVPFCWGVGNIVSASPETALRFLQEKVAIKLRSPKSIDLKRRMPAPVECVRKLADGALFCVTPDEMLRAMNQWYIGYEIEKRKTAQQCLFCGKHVKRDRLVCPEHFSGGRRSLWKRR